MAKYGPKPRPVLDRFMEKVDKNGPNGCWLWTGSMRKTGYGTFLGPGGRKGTVQAAHRWAYWLLVSEDIDGMDIDHLCRNHSCVNPDHLEAVTHRENNRRGVSPTAINARKTHCPRGHAYDEANTRITADGYRHCRACDRENKRALRAAG